MGGNDNYWGASTWKFIHTFIEKLKDEDFDELGLEIFNLIKNLCYNLPCPDCTQHATKFINNVNVNTLLSKQDLKNLFYLFHNIVNKRKNKPQFKYENLEVYKKYNLQSVYNDFVRNFHTRGNMNLINESFRRDRFIRVLQQWLVKNGHRFN
jgi:Erv1 / Alr family